MYIFMYICIYGERCGSSNAKITFCTSGWLLQTLAHNSGSVTVFVCVNIYIYIHIYIYIYIYTHTYRYNTVLVGILFLGSHTLL
jgi:hypothetical protein